MHRDQERTSPNQLANHTAVDYKTVALLRNRAARAVFERKVWAECRNGEESRGESPHTGVRGSREFAREDFGYGGLCHPNRE